MIGVLYSDRGAPEDVFKAYYRKCEHCFERWLSWSCLDKCDSLSTLGIAGISLKVIKVAVVVAASEEYLLALEVGVVVFKHVFDSQKPRFYCI